MEQNYYIIIDGQQRGPMNLASLVQSGLNPDSLVWCPGMPDWAKASTVPELQAWLNPKQEQPQSPYQQPQAGPYPQSPYQHPQANPYQQPYQQPYPGQYPPQPVNHTNWMTPAIIATVLGALFSCIGLIFGIIAITQASSANNAYARGDVYEGDRCNANAKTWTIVTYVLCGLGLIVGIISGFATFFSAIGGL